MWRTWYDRIYNNKPLKLSSVILYNWLFIDGVSWHVIDIDDDDDDDDDVME